MKKIILKVLNEIKYFSTIIGKKNINGDCRSARETLLSYSEKPKGYYNGLIDKPIDCNVDLSIIIPMYNVEKYIEQCLKSVIFQNTNYSYEIICIDDGSIDKSSEIAKKIQINNPEKNIRIVNQENRGFSGARNRGLDEAVGKYVMFIDSDDIVSPDIVNRLVSVAEETGNDIICCGYYIFDNSGEKRFCLQKAVNCFDDTHEIMKKYPMYFWGKVYKRSFWEKLRLPEGFWFEDMIVAHILTRLCKGYSYIDLPLYGYRYNPTGITATASKNIKSIDQYWMTEYISDEFDKRGWLKDQEYYQDILLELGPFLYFRTKDLPQNIRICMFVLASERIGKWKINSKSLTIRQRRLLKAFLERNFHAWQIVSMNWYS